MISEICSEKFNPKSVTVPMMVKRVMTAAGKPLPAVMNPLNKGFMLIVDASSKSVNRQLTAQLVVVCSNSSLVQDYYFTVDISKIPEHTKKPWKVKSLFLLLSLKTYIFPSCFFYNIDKY